MKIHTLRKLLLASHEGKRFSEEVIASAYGAKLISKEQAEELAREFGVQILFDDDW